MAAASAASFLPRLTYGLTYCGGISRTSCPRRPQLARPEVRCRAGLHSNETGRQLGEEGEHLIAPQPALLDDSAVHLDAVNLEIRTPASPSRQEIISQAS